MTNSCIGTFGTGGVVVPPDKDPKKCLFSQLCLNCLLLQDIGKSEKDESCRMLFV